ncbi:hypothetical protein FACS1894139_10390 [Planctomycetales bacterium]|nr:hypothetical protein FACS1894108_04910 [Planctomycetales bacterium]GHT05832.1 hypothetical protein FACS1894139_10390 [Planctomycetales bacterium]
MSQYFLRYRQRILGSYSVEQLRQMAENGKLGAFHAVSTDRQNWLGIEESGIFAAPSSAESPEFVADEEEPEEDLTVQEENAPTTITVSCACGKVINAPLKYLGKRVQCPQCGRPVSIVYAKDLTVLPKPAPAPLPPAPSNKKFCRTCGEPIFVGAVVCPQCGVPTRMGRDYCYDCGNKVMPNAVVCVKCGCPQVSADAPISSPWGYYVKCIKHYADFSGRARRSEYWYFVLFNFLFSLVPFLGWLYSLFALIPSLAVAWRRLHDVGHSGWVTLIPLIPLSIAFAIILLLRYILAFGYGWSDFMADSLGILLIGLIGIFIAICIWLFVLTVSNSQSGENKYGANPKDE